MLYFVATTVAQAIAINDWMQGVGVMPPPARVHKRLNVQRAGNGLVLPVKPVKLNTQWLLSEVRPPYMTTCCSISPPQFKSDLYSVAQSLEFLKALPATVASANRFSRVAEG
jgi:hypothetical protein